MYRRRRYARRRVYPRRASGYVRAKRSSRGRGLRYKKRTRPSRRRVLNISSIKKRDAMKSAFKFVGITGQTVQPQLTLAPPGLGAAMFVFSPTMRSKRDDPSSMPAQSTREITDCYARGFAETIRFATDSSSPWMWRRLIVSFYGVSTWTYPTGPGSAGISLPANDANITGQGHYRIWQQLLPDIAGPELPQQQAVRNAFIEKVFQGTLNIDYDSVFTAKPDTESVRVHYDATSQISSSSDAGKLKIVRRWHPISKRIIYDDRESGKTDPPRMYAKENRSSNGDVYIIDMFISLSPNEGNNLSFGSDAIYYWHER